MALGLEARARDVELVEELAAVLGRPVGLEPHLIAELELQLVLAVVALELEAVVVRRVDARLAHPCFGRSLDRRGKRSGYRRRFDGRRERPVASPVRAPAGRPDQRVLGQPRRLRAADSGNQMRVNGGGYIYNLSTKPFTTGVDYTVRIKTADGTIIGRAVIRTSK